MIRRSGRRRQSQARNLLEIAQATPGLRETMLGRPHEGPTGGCKAMFRNKLTTSLAVLTLAGALLPFLAGCENHDGNEWQRLVCEVESVNAGNPLVSAYLNTGADGIEGTVDDFRPIDIIPIVFHARPYSGETTLPEDGPNSYFDVVSYDLEWVPGPDCPDELLDYNIYDAPCIARVPAYDEGSVAVLVADRGMKEQDWYVELYDDRTYSFTATAILTFYGHESGSDELIEIPAALQVTFYGVVASD
jgi:hypothetical protein